MSAHGSLGNQNSLQGVSPWATGGRIHTLGPKGQKVPILVLFTLNRSGATALQLLQVFTVHVESRARLADREGSRRTSFPSGTPKQMAKTWIPHKKLENTLGSCVAEVPYSALVLMEIINSIKSTRRKKNVQTNRRHKTQIEVNDLPILLCNRGMPGTTT